MYFWQYQIWDGAAKAKNPINQLKIIPIQWKYNIISLRNTLNVTFLTFPRGFTPKNAELGQQRDIMTRNHRSSFKFYPNPEKFYTIPDGVDGNTFQVWSHLILSCHISTNITSYHIIFHYFLSYLNIFHHVSLNFNICHHI